jgi:hypothetical protein
VSFPLPATRFPRLGRPAMAAALLEMPAGAMPVAAEVGPVLRDHHQVPLPWLDETLTSGAHVTLPGRIRLHGRDDLGFESAGRHCVRR